MGRIASGQRAAASVWSWAVAMCLVGVAVVFGLATVAPVAMENSVAGLSVRLAVSSLCTAGFVLAAWRK